MIKFANHGKEILCNMCGKSCAMDLMNDGSYKENEGLLLAKVTGGYPSTPGNGDGALDDMDQYEFSLCEFCLDFLFSNFAIPPRVCEIGLKPPPHVCTGSKDDIIERNEEPFVPAEQRVMKDDWRRFKKEFFNRKLERDQARNIEKKLIDN